MSKKHRKSARQLYTEAYRAERLSQSNPTINTAQMRLGNMAFLSAIAYREDKFLGWINLYRAEEFCEMRSVRFPDLKSQVIFLDLCGDIPF